MINAQADDSISSRTNIATLDDTGYVIGVDIGGTNLRIALADLTGTIVARVSLTTIEIRDVERVIQMISENVDALLREKSVSRNALRAIAAGAPGVTDANRGVVIITSYLMGWRNVPLQDLLEKEFGVPAAVDNDVNLAAIGEGRAGVARDVSNFVFMAIGTGIGAGIQLNGQLVHGDTWTAGEIGYMLVPGLPDAPVELGQPGTLEASIGGGGIKAQWQSLWNENETTLPSNAPATDIFDDALRGNTLALKVLQSCARTLAYVIYNVSLVLNCRLFVLGGGVGIHTALVDATRTILESRDARVQPELLASSLNSDAQLVGAIYLALDTAKHEVRSQDKAAVESIAS